MKKFLSVTMLLASITVNLCGQSKADKTFEVPANIVFNRRFDVDLEKGNRMQLYLSDINDLQRLSNIDSLLQVFLDDLYLLKDSLSDPLTAKRIDYVTDQQDRKKIRFRQQHPKGASFLLSNGELASLRTEQDTVYIIGIIKNPPSPQEKISSTHPRYFQLSFFLNNLSELSAYMNGPIKGKLATIQNEVNSKWPLVLGTGSRYLGKDRSITADRRRGFTGKAVKDFLVLNFTVNAQNYKNYFVPSFTLGAKATLSNRDQTFKWEPGLFWEPHFIFAKNAQDQLRTYRNDFLTLTYAQGGTKDYDPRKDFAFSAQFSFGYLVYRQGEYFEKKTFRLGGGKFSIYKTTIEPSMYFNNFFRGVTPCIRISQYF